MVNTPRLIFIALLFVAAASAQQYCTFISSATIAGLYDENGYCNCYSGYFSSEPHLLNCFNKAPESCSWKPAPQQLSTGYVPILDEAVSGVFGGNIVMVVRSPLVTNRLATTAAWQNGASDYSYPGRYWEKTVEDCNDTFTFTLPMSKAYDSGFEPSEDDTYYYLNGIVVFTYYDSIGEIRGQPITRTTQSILRVEIRFPKRITVTSRVSVYSGYDLLAVITFQAYDPVSNNGIFEYTTSLPYPFRVSNVTELTFPSPVDGVTGPVQDVSCNTTQNTNCLQKFRLTTNPNGACKLSGDYNITVAIGCRGDATCSPGSGVISSQITSEDICSVVRVDIDLTGSMKVYTDDTFSTPAKSFLPGQTPYFLASVASSKALIESSSISDVFYTMPDGTSNSLYSSGAANALASSNRFDLTPVNATSSSFKITISVGDSANDLFKPSALDPSAFPSTGTPSATTPSAATTPAVATTPTSTAGSPTTAPSGGAAPIPGAPVSSTAPVGAAPVPTNFLDPIVDCVEQVNSTSYTAYFGYQNPVNGPVVIAVGANNGFNGNGLTNANVGQPTYFPLYRSVPYPIGAFQYKWNGSSPVSWTLNGVNRVADPTNLANRCPTTVSFIFSFLWNGTFPRNASEEGEILSRLSAAMGLRSKLNLVHTKTMAAYSPYINALLYGLRIDPSINAPDITARQAFQTLYAIRNDPIIMKAILDPYGWDPTRAFHDIEMTPLPNEISSYVYPSTVYVFKRAVDPTNSLLAQEMPQRREIVHSVKRDTEQDVSGNVQFSAVIEVQWVGLTGRKKRFAFNLQQAELPNGSQDKKFSAFIGVGQGSTQNVEPTSISTNVPDPTSGAISIYASGMFGLIMVNLL